MEAGAAACLRNVFADQLAELWLLVVLLRADCKDPRLFVSECASERGRQVGREGGREGERESMCIHSIHMHTQYTHAHNTHILCANCHCVGLLEMCLCT
jgi:hypothetical protein